MSVPECLIIKWKNRSFKFVCRGLPKVEESLGYYIHETQFTGLLTSTNGQPANVIFRSAMSVLYQTIILPNYPHDSIFYNTFGYWQTCAQLTPVSQFRFSR